MKMGKEEEKKKKGKKPQIASTMALDAAAAAAVATLQIFSFNWLFNRQKTVQNVLNSNTNPSLVQFLWSFVSN